MRRLFETLKGSISVSIRAEQSIALVMCYSIGAMVVVSLIQGGL